MSTEPRRDASGEDAALASAWRAASRDEPPASVDAAILAAASAELRGGGRERPAQRRWWSTWQPLAAAAGVAGLAFVLVQTLPEHAAPRAPEVSEQATAVDSGPPRPEADAAVVAEPSSAAKAAPPPPAQRYESRAESRPVTTAPMVHSAPVAAAPPGATSANNLAAASAPTPAPPAATADRRAARAATERQTAAAASMEGLAASVEEPLSPEGWVARIVASYDAGDRRGAEYQLAAFRQAYPEADRHLPDELRDWAAAIPAPARESPP